MKLNSKKMKSVIKKVSSDTLFAAGRGAANALRKVRKEEKGSDPVSHSKH